MRVDVHEEVEVEVSCHSFVLGPAAVVVAVVAVVVDAAVLVVAVLFALEVFVFVLFG